MTGLFNRGYFIDLFNENWHIRKSDIADESFEVARVALIIFDIDLFKVINDRYGHLAGDLVLKSLSDCVHGNLRHGESLCRYGGEEFVVLLQETDLESSIAVAQRLRDKIEKLSVIWKDQAIDVTASFGVTYYEGHAHINPDDS